ncbi:MAG TPA: hypothetical protein VF602_03345 [Pedobacter sp.]|jgi:hypothetical protein
MKTEKDIIPENTKGAQTDTSYTQEYETVEEAVLAYQESKQKLLNITQWHSYAGTGTAEFQLTDKNGQEVNRLAEEGDHFQINIPGPGSKAGDGYDWVQIESITSETTNNTELTAIKVRPATSPQNSKQETAHFFNNEASSTFLVKREGNTVKAEVHGRNEQANTEAESLIDKTRNIIVAVGAMLGLSDVQWKSLVKGLIKS